MKSTIETQGAELRCPSPRSFLITPQRGTLVAFVLYLVLSVILFGRSLIGQFQTRYIGVGPDPALMIWSLAWWPHAISQSINPFITHALFAPTGLNLTWQTSIPFASAVISPVTALLGPVAAYNILCLVSIPLNAGCAFILCRYLTESYWPSFFAGYIYGFSAFFLGHLVFGDLHMLLSAPVPLIVYLAVRALTEEVAALRLVTVVSALLVAQFLESLEIFATLVFVSAFSLAVAYACIREARQRIRWLLRPMLLSVGVTSIVVSPYLYYFFAGFTSKSVWPADFFNSDLLNFVVPTQANETGRLSSLISISARFPGGSIAENGSYIGVPLLVMALLYCRYHWVEPLGRFLTIILVSVCILSLGPVLHIAGRPAFDLLSGRLIELPVLKNAMAVRLSMYAFLDLAVISALWLASDESGIRSKCAFVGLFAVFNLPNLSGQFWTSVVDTPTFFQRQVYQQDLRRGETVLVLPYGENGNALLWQAQSGFFFNMAEGGAGVRMEEWRRWPIVGAFEKKTYVPQAAEQFKAFTAAHNISTVVIVGNQGESWKRLLMEVAGSRIEEGGVALYRMPQPAPGCSNSDTMIHARAAFDEQRILKLISGVQRYLSKGGSTGSLSAANAAALKIIAPEALLGPALTFDPSLSQRRMMAADPRLAYDLWLAPWSDNRISLGELAWYPAVKKIIDQLRPILGDIDFIDLPAISAKAVGPDRHDMGLLLLVFTYKQLDKAANMLELLTRTETKEPLSAEVYGSGGLHPENSAELR